MSLSPAEQQANHWIEMTRMPVEECSDELFDAGFALNILAHDDPELAWNVILEIVDILDEKDLVSGEGDAQKLASNLAAGPLESLLTQHGEVFIDRLEQKAKADSRFGLVLGGVWQNAMPDTVWKSVRNLADNRLR